VSIREIRGQDFSQAKPQKKTNSATDCTDFHRFFKPADSVSIREIRGKDFFQGKPQKRTNSATDYTDSHGFFSRCSFRVHP
jgi:hypothetical protein